MIANVGAATRSSHRVMPGAALPPPAQVSTSRGTQNAAMAGADPIAYVRERPGMSTFLLENGIAYHTYSTYARGLDGVWGMYQWLDRAPKGRNEKGVWWRHHDRYGHD
jgi:predicted dithiol-disulfide oxidoreductase (DUF899 family)